jgi:AcrR family transcriptional regulator
MARTVGSAAEDTRERILDASRELFVEQGYAGTSVRDIADRLGMTKGSLYYHFASKEELLLALMTPLVEALDDFVAQARAAEVISGELLRMLVDRLDEHGPVLRSLFGDPSVAHHVLDRLRLNERLVAMLGALGATDDPMGQLRARCALGVINTGVLAPTDLARRKDPTGPPPNRPRLTEAEKGFVVGAALAVLGAPVPN